MIFGFEIVDVLIFLVGISLLPLFIDTLNTFIPIGRIVHVYISRLLVSVLFIQYFASIYYFFTLVIPFYSESSEIVDYSLIREIFQNYNWRDSYFWDSWSIQFKSFVIFGGILAVWLWINTIFCYIQAIRHSPKPLETLGDTEIKKLKENDKNIRICEKCKVIKKENTHHCSQCGRCIPNMDHHCPFTSNCVSTGKRGNFTFFFLFIFYTAAGCAFAVSTMVLPFYFCYFQREISMRCVPVGTMSLIFIPGVLLLLATGGFTLLHIILNFYGRTTIEFLHWFTEHDNAATSSAVETAEYIDQEHKKLKKMSKIHCSFFEFLFPYFIKIEKPKLKSK